MDELERLRAEVKRLTEENAEFQRIFSAMLEVDKHAQTIHDFFTGNARRETVPPFIEALHDLGVALEGVEEVWAPTVARVDGCRVVVERNA